MTLPNKFSHWEHLKNMLKRDHNKLVSMYFKDLGEGWEPEVNSNRGAIRVAATIDDNDTSTMVLTRLYYFFDVLGYGRKDLANIYGSVLEKYVPPVEGHPTIGVYFSQDLSAVPEGNSAATAEYTFTLMDEDYSSFNPAKSLVIANEIKKLFVESRKGIVFTKGLKRYTYTNAAKGYRLRLDVNTELDAIEIIKKLLELQNVAYESSKLKFKGLQEPKKPKTVKTYGKNRKVNTVADVAKVQFRYAYADVGLPKPIYLLTNNPRHASVLRF